MTAFARVITIGRNDRMPKVVRVPVGVGVDGCVIRAPMTIQADEVICPVCEGWGEYGHYTCDRCDGGGIITLDETQPPAGEECLPPPAGEGRPDVGPSSGRLPPSTSTVDARAAGDLRCSLNARPKTHSHRSVPIVTAPRPPAVPPVGLAGTLERVLDGVTVIVGMTVFSSIAWFFLVLA